MKLRQIKMGESEVYDEIPIETVPQWVVKEFNKVSKRRGDIRVKGRGKRYIIRVFDKKPDYYVCETSEKKEKETARPGKSFKPRPRDL